MRGKKGDLRERGRVGREGEREGTDKREREET